MNETEIEFSKVLGRTRMKYNYDRQRLAKAHVYGNRLLTHNEHNLSEQQLKLLIDNELLWRPTFEVVCHTFKARDIKYRKHERLH